jgi:hypothetical protein
MGTLHYLMSLRAELLGESLTDPMTAFAGKAPRYPPAAKEARKFVHPKKHKRMTRATVESKTSGSHSKAERDRTFINGRWFSPNTEDIRDGGECVWDTLRSYEISDEHLALAADDAGLTVDVHVNDDQVWPLLQALEPRTGRTYHLRLERINLVTLAPLGTLLKGDGEIQIVIGMFDDPFSGGGHYVPPH